MSKTTVNYLQLCFCVRNDGKRTNDEVYGSWSAMTKNYIASDSVKSAMVMSYSLHSWTPWSDREVFKLLYIVDGADIIVYQLGPKANSRVAISMALSEEAATLIFCAASRRSGSYKSRRVISIVYLVPLSRWQVADWYVQLQGLTNSNCADL